MKKNFKRIVALGMAISTLGATSAFAAVSSKFTGSINSDSLKLSISIPATGTLTIKPYAAEQITTGVMSATNDSTEVKYQISVAGYTVTATSKTDEAISLVKDLTADNKKEEGKEPKEITLDMKLLAASDIKTKTSDITGGSDIEFDTLSEEAYKSADSAYTKVKDTGVEVNTSDKNLNFAIVGTMNSSANWVAGDALTIVPIFKIVPAAA